MLHHYFSRATFLLLLSGLLLALVRPAAAQTVPDSARISYSEETMTDSTAFEGERKLQRKLRRITRLQIEEHQLWKIDLTSFSVGGSESYYGLDLLVEQKLRPSWSVLAGLNPQVERYRQPLSGHPGTTTGFAVKSQLAGRYYYNLNRRIRKGKSASNFSANYLSLGLGTGFGRRGADTPYYSGLGRGHAVRAAVAAFYGMQRRLGRYGFVDLNLGLPLPLAPTVGPLFPDNSLRILFNIQLGLALGR